ncbi:2-succinyl-6-hydroxy-2,4-cyclohexadiene-1-carboxylate synthase [compost metagenome]
MINTFQPLNHPDVRTFAYSTRNEGGCRKYYADHFREHRLTLFDELDYQMVQNLRKSFYPNPAVNDTLTFQHGHPTEKVYVFVHGLYSSANYFLNSGIKKFTEGHNVIIATLPGHENSNMPTEENNVALWTAYADYLGHMARQYGKKVIFVGQSIGGNISIHAAELGHADELVLIQPYLALTRRIKASMKVASVIPDFALKNIPIEPAPARDSNLYEVAEAGKQARLILALPFSKLNPNIPVHIYADRFDAVVSTSAVQDWIPEFAPQSTIEFHSKGHMHNPLQ